MYIVYVYISTSILNMIVYFIVFIKLNQEFCLKSVVKLLYGFLCHYYFIYAKQ